MTTFTDWVTSVEAKFQVTEEWIVAQITTAWQKVEAGEAWVDTELTQIDTWLNSNHAGAISLLTGVLQGLQLAGLPVPAPAAEATVAVDAATAALDQLAAGLKAGSTPVSTVSNAYQAVKSAQNAVNVVLKSATAKPAAA